MEEGGRGMNTFVLLLYMCVWMFLFGWLLGLVAAKDKVNIGDVFAAAFFAMIWPVTIVIYVLRKVLDALEEKGYENEE